MNRLSIWNSCILALLLVTILSATVRAQSTRPEDFARGMPIQSSGSNPIQVFVLPADVYRTIRSSRLDDIRVYNGDREEVPYALVASLSRNEEIVHRSSLPVFPVKGVPGRTTDDYSVLVERTATGMVVDVNEQRLPGQPNPVVAYLIDASQLKSPVRYLSFEWQDAGVEFVTDVIAETSDDLTNWSPWGSAVTLAGLQYDQDTLRQASMELPPRRSRYIRLTWPDGGSLPPIRRIEASHVERSEPERAWVQSGATSSKPFVHIYNLKGLFPIDRVQLRLPQLNSLARVTIASSNTSDGQWVERASGLVYRIHLNQRDLQNVPFQFASSTDSLWRVEIDPSGGGLGAKAPVLESGYIPDRVAFLKRGNEPFLFAFGSVSARSSALNDRNLDHFLNGREQLYRQSLATLGPAYDLGGKAVLVPSRDIPWQRIVLWSILLVGVLILAWMAVRLLRQLDTRSEADRKV